MRLNLFGPAGEVVEQAVFGVLETVEQAVNQRFAGVRVKTEVVGEAKAVARS